MHTETPGQGAAELDLVHGQRVLQGLRVRVDRPELDPLHASMHGRGCGKRSEYKAGDLGGGGDALSRCMRGGG